MTEAGLSSIVGLQFQNSPQKVRDLLDEWAQGKEDRQLLMPAVRALWRDMLVLIPIYTVALFLGSRLALSLVKVHFGQDPHCMALLSLLSRIGPLWIPALALALLCAMADYAEDLGQLRFIAIYPKQPSRLAVLLTFAATLVKTVLFLIGFVLTAGATVALASRPFLQLREILHGGRVHTIGLIAAIYAPLLILAQFKSLLAARRKRELPRKPRHRRPSR